MLADPQRPRWGVPQPLQVIEHTFGGLVAMVGFLFQEMHDDVGQRLWYGAVHFRRRHRHPRQVIMGEPQRIAGTERRAARSQLVQRRTQRVQVGTLIHRPRGPPGLLGGQIGQRPHDLDVVGELGTNLGQRRRQREIDQTRSRRRAISRRSPD